MPTKTLVIEGMSCEHCAKAVKSALESVDGVLSANVSLEHGRATIEVDESVYTSDAATSAVVEEGYDVVGTE